MGGLDVLGQQQHPDLGTAVLDVARGPGSFVGVRRGHADVEDDQVRLLLVDDLGDGASASPSVATTSCPPSANSRASPSPQQHLVLDDHDTHGSSAVSRGAVAPDAVDVEASAARGHPVRQPGQSGAASGVRAAHAVVGDADHEPGVVPGRRAARSCSARRA